MSDCRDRLTVLVADDSRFSRSLVKQCLPPEEYEVLLAGTGREALEQYAKCHPPLVVTDWLMPDLTGVELCRAIRGGSGSCYTYIIVLTSVSEKDKVVEALDAGADDYVTKPVHPAELVARVRAARRILALQQEIESKNRQLQAAALTDSLTGLPNRRSLEHWGAKLLSGAARHGYFLWVVMADLDHFKNVNDNCGHAAGDAVLKRFAELLRGNTRQDNICGRIGGEEFLLILTHVDLEGVLVAIERIRQQFAEQVFAFGGETTRVTASFGVAGFSGTGSGGLDSLIKEADAALYAAKGKGRNRVELAGKGV